MILLQPKPYIKTERKDFREPVTIQLLAANFSGIAPIPSQLAVSFQYCFFDELIIQNNEEIDFEEVSLSFSNCFIRQLTIEKITAKNVSVYFHACMLAGRITAPELKAIGVNNCLLEYGITLMNLPKVELSYTTENIFLFGWQKMFEQRKIPSLSAYLREQQRYQLVNIGDLHIKSSKKETDKAGVYRLHSNTMTEYLIGYHLTNDEEELLKISISIEFPADSIDKRTLIENLNLQSLSLNGNPNGKVIMENVNLKNWYLSEFSPKGDVSFYNIDRRKPYGKGTKIGIHRCNLDKVWFDNVYFGEFERLSFYRSKFSNAIFTSCSFPEDYATYEKFQPIENVHYPERRTANHHKDQYEIFLQLKKALEATGNTYEGLKLQAISQTALHKISTIAKSDKFILWTNRVSNDHGLSIKRPFWWFLGLTTLFYLFYLWCAGLLFQPTTFDPDLIGYYFSFIDITHKTDFLKDKNGDLNALSLTLDYLNKIMTGYLIFQFVASFRKYGKNK